MSLKRRLAATAVILLTASLLALPGCAAARFLTGSAGGAGAKAGSVTASTEATAPIVHVVVLRSGGRQPTSRRELWYDPATGWSRTSLEDTLGASWDGRESLQRDGVWTILDGDGSGRRGWSNALVYDAQPGVAGGTLNTPTDPTDLAFFRSAVASGQAQVVGTSTVAGVPVYRVRMALPARPGWPRSTLTADVRRGDYAPVRVVATNASGLATTFRYLVAEAVPRAQGMSHFALAIPSGVHVIEARTLSQAQAAVYPFVRVWWLGKSFEGLPFAPEGTPRSPVPPGFQLSRYAGSPEPLIFGTFPTAGEQLTMAGPRLGFTRVTATYGDLTGSQKRHGAKGGPLMHVVSYPATDTANWKLWPSGTPPTWSSIAGHKTLSFSRTLGMGLGTAHYVVVDTGNATVVVEGLGISEAAVARAAAALVPVQ